jgi:DNA-binding SARP family transcriptional activator
VLTVGPGQLDLDDFEQLAAQRRDALTAGNDQLMLALYRAGRQADALECHRVGRQAMLDELRIEPCRAFQDLEAAILRQTPGSSPPTARIEA